VFSKEKWGTRRSQGRRTPRWDGKGMAVTDDSVTDRRKKGCVGLQGEVDSVAKVDMPGFREPVDGCRQAWVSVWDEVRAQDREVVNRQGR